MVSGPGTKNQILHRDDAPGGLSDQLLPHDASALSNPRSYARARVAVAPVGSTSSLRGGATATRRWSREETKIRATAGPKFLFPRPTPPELDELIREYEQTTGDRVRTNPKRNFLAACYRIHGDDFLPLARETFGSTGTVTNLLGLLRETPPRDTQARLDRTTQSPKANPPTETDAEGWSDLRERDPGTFEPDEMASDEGQSDEPYRPSQADTQSAWCGCPVEDLRPDVLYCVAHRPGYLSVPRRRYDRRESNPAAARYFALAGQSTPGAA